MRDPFELPTLLEVYASGIRRAAVAAMLGQHAEVEPQVWSIVFLQSRVDMCADLLEWSRDVHIDSRAQIERLERRCQQRTSMSDSSSQTSTEDMGSRNKMEHPQCHCQWVAMMEALVRTLAENMDGRVELERSRCQCQPAAAADARLQTSTEPGSMKGADVTTPNKRDTKRKRVRFEE